MLWAQLVLEPNLITYNAAISACEKGKQPDKALELLEETQRKGMEPGSITYNAASSACEKSKAAEQGLGAPRQLAAERLGPQHDHLQCSNQRMREGMKTTNFPSVFHSETQFGTLRR